MRLVLRPHFAGLVVGGTAYAVAIGTLAATMPVMAIALIVGPMVALCAHARPTLAIGGWLLLTALVPEWTRVPVAGVGGVKVYQLAAIPVLVGVILARKRRGAGKVWVDLALLGAVVVVFVFAYEGRVPRFIFINVVDVLMLGYVMGRLSSRSIYRAIAVVTLVIAVWGIVEYLLDWHAFVNWQPSSTQHWNEIQIRAGRARSEATMGHAIAFGATCAMGFPFMRYLTSRFTVYGQAVLVAGVFTSLSRGPMLALLLTVLLAAILLARASRRVTSLLIVGVVGVIVYAGINFVYSGADSSDVQLSGDQRSVQLQQTLDQTRFFGPSEETQVTDEGRLSTGDTQVIDSTPLRLALTYGWLVALVFLSPIFYVGSWAIRRRAGPACVALLGQIPALIVTSLITQWQVIVFFLAGIAMSEVAMMRKQVLADEVIVNEAVAASL